MRKLFFLILTICTLTTCERDDICPESTPTTPNLIIRFYDSENQENLKSVNSLTILGEGNEIEYIASSTTDSIAIPLKTDTNSTTFLLYSNSTFENGEITGNPDTVTFEYDTQELYVSRACGYKTVFEITDINLETQADSDLWIQFIPFQEIIPVNDETSAHVQIFH